MVFAFTLVIILIVQTSPAFSITHLCDDPTFDAAVAISQTQVLLFKNTSLWVVDLLNYQVDLMYPNADQMDNCLKSVILSKGPLLAWNQHDNFANLKSKICLSGDDKICSLTADRDPMKENGVYFHNVSRPNSNQEVLNCSKDTQLDGTTVAMMTRTVFTQEQGNKDVWITGPRFRAHISYIAGTYDDTISLLKVIVQKKVNSVYRGGGGNSYSNRQSPRSTLAEVSQVNRFNASNLIDGVQTFAVLPTGELMLFFDDQFCYLSYYNMKCSKRFTSFLLGCADSI
ncbi:hypothetical protein TYRP_018346 [Tyrophagus putrescentiae]|nr:hypothetical protein TYRP_018346 [Tyrophagus putrescentiae]